MTEPSEFMLNTERLAGVLDQRDKLGDKETLDLLRQYVDADMMWSYPPGTTPLVEKSRNLVALLDDAEVNHGGLLSVDVLKVKNELRLELARWGK